MKDERVAKNIKCPKCKSSISKLEELWSGIGQVYEFDEKGNIVNSFVPGCIENNLIFFATCSNANCSHRWKLKGKKNIKEIDYWEQKASVKDGWKYMKKEDKLYK